eukprot:scaffold57392_cov25-Attheya_sp.AAC.1
MLTLASGRLPFLAMFHHDLFGVPPINMLAAIISCDRACVSFRFVSFLGFEMLPVCNYALVWSLTDDCAFIAMRADLRATNLAGNTRSRAGEITTNK